MIGFKSAKMLQHFLLSKEVARIQALAAVICQKQKDPIQKQIETLAQAAVQRNYYIYQL